MTSTKTLTNLLQELLGETLNVDILCEGSPKLDEAGASEVRTQCPLGDLAAVVL